MGAKKEADGEAVQDRKLKCLLLLVHRTTTVEEMDRLRSTMMVSPLLPMTRILSCGTKVFWRSPGRLKE
jgi:hypothetical protein